MCRLRPTIDKESWTNRGRISIFYRETRTLMRATGDDEQWARGNPSERLNARLKDVAQYRIDMHGNGVVS